MEIQTKARGADTPDLAGPCLEFAMLYATEGKNAQAETQYRRAISLAENTEGVAGHNLPETLAEYAFFLKKQNRNEEAEKLLQRAREIVAKRQAAVQNQTPQF
jgi:hypothetical protein